MYIYDIANQNIETTIYSYMIHIHCKKLKNEDVIQMGHKNWLY